MTKQDYLKAAEFINKHCQADDFTFNISFNDNIQTRYAQNAITQNMGGKFVKASITVAFDDKTGTAGINNLSENSLKEMLEIAENSARNSLPDPEYTKSASKIILPDIKNSSEETEMCSEKELATVAGKAIESSKSKNLFVSGFVTRFVQDNFVYTKNGFEGYDKLTYFTNSMTLSDNKSKEVKAEKSVKNFANFSIEKEIEKLQNKYKFLTEPKPFDKGSYNVILRPMAVYNFFSFMLYFMGRREADLGITVFRDGIGKQIFGEKFSLISRIDNPDISAVRFNSAGIAAKNINWISNGVLENLIVGKDYAKVKNIEPSFPSNIIIEGGDTEEEEMMKKVANGIIINNFWYIRDVNSRVGEITGLTRDGLYYFENGKIQHSVTNFRFNEIFTEVTKRILSLGKSEQIYHDVSVPSMLIKDFTFVDTTTF